MKTGRSVDFKSSVNKSTDKANFIAERSKTKKKKLLRDQCKFFYEKLKNRSHAKSFQPKYPKRKVYRRSVSRK